MDEAEEENKNSKIETVVAKVSGTVILVSSICVTQLTFSMFHLYKEIFLIFLAAF